MGAGAKWKPARITVALGGISGSETGSPSRSPTPLFGGEAEHMRKRILNSWGRGFDVLGPTITPGAVESPASKDRGARVSFLGLGLVKPSELCYHSHINTKGILTILQGAMRSACIKVAIFRDTPQAVASSSRKGNSSHSERVRDRIRNTSVDF